MLTVRAVLTVLVISLSPAPLEHLSVQNALVGMIHVGIISLFVILSSCSLWQNKSDAFKTIFKRNKLLIGI